MTALTILLNMEQSHRSYTLLQRLLHGSSVEPSVAVDLHPSVPPDSPWVRESAPRSRSLGWPRSRRPLRTPELAAHGIASKSERPTSRIVQLTNHRFLAPYNERVHIGHYVHIKGAPITIRRQSRIQDALSYE